ncbi:PACE efflux transporter [Thiomicrorhabdus sediminis]|uniref:PACE efflux transporter n=1 Tax=Thiomicrorhabdus sediminis TaxID=2580412 RepID=A0A4P9K7P2_9GAMM|nr:PACE efflux transporter [Thiomicrorhabdus sediminis]
MTLTRIKRRLLYVIVFEITAIILSTFVLMLLSNSDVDESLPVAILMSTAAVVWNYLFNTAFEFWETRQQINKRTLAVRSLHALGFEGGLILICVPLYMVWYGVDLWTAFAMEAALLLFFLVYTFVFTFLFDQVFILQHQMPAKA